MTVNTFTILKLKFEYRFWAFSTCGRETKYSHASLLESCKRNICSSLSRSEIYFLAFLHVFSRGHGYVEATQCQMHILITTCPPTIIIVVFSNLCHNIALIVALWLLSSSPSMYETVMYLIYYRFLLNSWGKIGASIDCS